MAVERNLARQRVVIRTPQFTEQSLINRKLLHADVDDLDDIDWINLG